VFDGGLLNSGGYGAVGDVEMIGDRRIGRGNIVKVGNGGLLKEGRTIISDQLMPRGRPRGLTSRVLSSSDLEELFDVLDLFRLEVVVSLNHSKPQRLSGIHQISLCPPLMAYQ
jgi:hypothetical protein